MISMNDKGRLNMSLVEYTSAQMAWLVQQLVPLYDPFVRSVDGPWSGLVWSGAFVYERCISLKGAMINDL